jgi:hypothetical protein
MLLVLLPIAWLAVVVVIVAACQAAAVGDAPPLRTDEDAAEVIRTGLMLLDPLAAAPPREHWRGRTRLRGRSRARRGPHVPHGIRY